MFKYLGGLLSKLLENVGDSFSWLIMEMDLTQWAVIAVLFVVTGFVALKTKI